MLTQGGESVPITITVGQVGGSFCREYLCHRIWRDASELLAPPPGCRLLDGRFRLSDVWVRESETEILIWNPGFFQIAVDLAQNVAEAQLANPGEWQNVLRVLYFFGFLTGRRLLLHASGVVRRGAGYIFPGVSGAGKTTIVRQSPGMAVLSDDMLGIDLTQDQAFALGTPFYGDWGTPGEALRVPVKGLYFPVHGRENILTPLSYDAVVKKLLLCATVFTTWPSRMEQVFGLAMDLAQRVPGYSLSFRPDPDFWQVIDGS